MSILSVHKTRNGIQVVGSNEEDSQRHEHTLTPRDLEIQQEHRFCAFFSLAYHDHEKHLTSAGNSNVRRGLECKIGMFAVFLSAFGLTK